VLGVQPTGTSPEAPALVQREDTDRWAPAVKASGFAPSQKKGRGKAASARQPAN
jgi:hypothetical protein